MLEIFKHTLGAKGWLKAWAIYLIAFPYYIFPAGSAQPSDIFVALMIGFYILAGKWELKGESKQVFGKFLNFCIYLSVVNFGVFISLLGQRNSGLPWYFLCAFYIFNLLVMGFALSLFKQYGKAFLYTTAYACVISAIAQIVLSRFISNPVDDIRGVLFFTNPNQLGYYSLCGLAIILIMETAIKLPKLIIYLSFLLFTYMAVLSVSKAALGSMIILFGAYLIANKIFSVRNLLALLFVGGISLFVFSKTEIGSNFQNALDIREANEADRPDEITEWQYRGYDRITNHPEYLVFGAGEGGYNRFDTFIDNHEMHSSFGTIIFCYGIPGTVLFLMFVYAVLKKLSWFYLVYALPLFAYGVTHMGLRFTIFWVALMMFPIIRAERERVKQMQFIMSNKKLRDRLLQLRNQSSTKRALSQTPKAI
ncbi:MAG: hypothetical protein COW40_03580 [Cytophagales bacterium CG17_big_fil_post_rev_8_21_14_2_50_40_13]|nr:MAG: hypothetical protein COW40_03580 [Cytophagales bacterium CG17_big_fil_post_rev_8_21_14_2_50_40_13]